MAFLMTYKGHHQLGRWQARIGRVAGNKDLGTFTITPIAVLRRNSSMEVEFKEQRKRRTAVDEREGNLSVKVRW
ncbi:hypothetical protein RIF29_19274 [Crotalaria pallida]|uniref:Uncharacterized protein n=1 Tax=Crotalaria pallida TaxID=3830 RepID=A0AAN9F3J9_CROPI